MLKYYFTDTSGKILGPSLISQIREYIDTNHIDISSELCLEGTTDWKPAYTILKEAETAGASIEEAVSGWRGAPVVGGGEIGQAVSVPQEISPAPLSPSSVSSILQPWVDEVIRIKNLLENTIDEFLLVRTQNDMFVVQDRALLSIAYYPLGRVFRVVETGRDEHGKRALTIEVQ